MRYNAAHILGETNPDALARASVVIWVE
jgi:hypothetical protein